MSTATPYGKVRIAGQTGRFTHGVFTSGAFAGQRAISNDGRTYLPAGKATPTELKPMFSDVFSDIFGDIFSGAPGRAA